MATAKTTEYTIIKYGRRRNSEFTGTVEQLTESFSYTLACGASYNPKINEKPKTIKGLVSALNKCVSELQRGSFDPDYYELKK